MEFGATDFVMTSDENFAEPWAGKIDIIIVCSTLSLSPEMLIHHLSF